MNPNAAFSYLTAPTGERPRERCLRLGAQSLTLQELLALLLSPGVRGRGCWETSHALVREDFWAVLRAREMPAWLERAGVPQVARTRVLAASELALRFVEWERQGEQRHSLHRRSDEVSLPQVAMAALAAISSVRRASRTEWLGLIAINRSGHVGELQLIAEGGARAVAGDLRTLALKVLLLDAHAVILAHNHPSGRCEASEDDRVLTRNSAQLCERLGAPLLGHWIVSRRGELWLPASNS